MSDGVYVALTMMPYFIGLVAILTFVITYVIPEAKKDAQWYAYNDAYKRWEKNGKIGKMPRFSDYGKDGE